MIGITSKSAGVLLLPKSGTSEYTVLDLLEGKEKNPVEAKYLYSAVQDWEEIEGSDANALLDGAKNEYWLERAVSLLRLAIGGLEESLEKEVLEHVEEILGSRASSEKTLNRLLVAPLKDPGSSVALAKSALSNGFSAVAPILDELADLQQLLHRLTDLWLGLSETAFSHFSESREMIWVTVVEGCRMKELLLANSREKFMNKWNLLMFTFPFTAPQSRIGIGTLGKEISHRLFPNEVQEEKMSVLLTEEAESTSRDEEEQVVRGYETFKRVEKQIVDIAKDVSQGRDTRAKRFLGQLIKKQTSVSGGDVYAVKTLCNIAQHCADMFRMDFEAFCLNEARQLSPFDGWTLVQYGDHLKRIGNYSEALISFEKAEQLGESIIAKSSAADVYSHQGYYAKAILAYESIPNWSDKPKVRTAIADNLRRMGRMDESEAAYKELIHLAQQGLPEFAASEVRAQAGIAEIAKRQGKLEDALQTYYGILARKDIGGRGRLIYKLGLCNVLKLMEKFDDAYAVVDEVIQQYPFAMQARFTRGSILGLLGWEAKGLEDLPESSGPLSWREWAKCYYRGLLLLKLKRYEGSKKNLVEELSRTLASGEEKAILRMASALCFLSDNEIPEADGILSNIPDLHDCHAQYLSLVLKLHSATHREDIAVMHSLKKQIAELKVVNAGLEKAIVALEEKDFSHALTYETDALLKLAA